jgi:hypothetical protein
MGFGDGKMIGGPMSGPPPAFVICEPVLIPASGVMTCRRGQGQRTFQGQKPPTCGGIVGPAKIGNRDGFCCNLCGLTHDKIAVNGVPSYGAVL